MALGSNSLQKTITVVALAMAVYHLVATQYVLFSPIQHQNVHLGLALLIIYLKGMREGGLRLALTMGLLLISLIGALYVQFFYMQLEYRMDFPTSLDLIIGGLLLITVLEATRRALGMVLTSVALFFIAYALLGHMLPRPFEILAIPVTQLIYELSVGFTGIYGMVLGVSANYIFLFVLLGAVINVTGGPVFFKEVGNAVGRLFKGGPAMTAVVGSALVGSVTGAPSANIAITGSFTIPLMKQAGYPPHQAAAIEGAASTGGQLVPPVMSAAAFLMSGITGQPYVNIMLAAIIPALLYYLSIGLYVQLQAMKMDLRHANLSMDRKAILWNAPSFIFPLIVIIFLFIRGFSPMYVGFWSVVAAMATGFIKRGNRPTVKEWIEAFVSGAVTASNIAVSCACIGIMVKVMTMTGLGMKLPSLVEAWSHGYLFLALVMVMIVSLILGCGVPTAPAYIMVAIIGAPVLVKLGVSVLQAHFFVFYFAVMSMLTPPVAPAAVISCKLANASFMRTAFEQVKPAVAGFLIPFMIVYCPVLILEPTNIMLGLPRLFSLIVSVICLQVGINNFLFLKCGRLERVLFFFCTAVLITGAPQQLRPLYFCFILGLAAFIVLVMNQLKRRKVLMQSSPGKIGDVLA